MKRGYFFSLDAYVALGIMITSLIILYSYHTEIIPNKQAHQDASNILLLLTTTRINEMNINYVTQLIKDGTIENPTQTILEQLGEFYFLNETGIAKKFLAAIIDGYNMPQYGFAFFIEGKKIYERKGIPDLKNNVLASRNIVSGVYNSTTIWGPYRVEVIVYQ